MIVRVKPGVASSAFDPHTGTYVALVEGGSFDSDDEFVKANAWAFTTDAEAEKVLNRRPARVTSVRVEDMTANPGEKRNR